MIKFLLYELHQHHNSELLSGLKMASNEEAAGELAPCRETLQCWFLHQCVLGGASHLDACPTAWQHRDELVFSKTGGRLGFVPEHFGGRSLGCAGGKLELLFGPATEYVLVDIVDCAATALCCRSYLVRDIQLPSMFVSADAARAREPMATGLSFVWDSCDIVTMIASRCTDRARLALRKAGHAVGPWLLTMFRNLFGVAGANNANNVLLAGAGVGLMMVPAALVTPFHVMRTLFQVNRQSQHSLTHTPV